MKKKQLVALALVGALSVSAAASVLAPASAYAAEKSEAEKLADLAKDYASKFSTDAPLKTFFEKYDDKVETEDLKLSDAKLQELAKIFKQAEVLLGKKLGALEVKEGNILSEIKKAQVDHYTESLIKDRKKALEAIEKAEGKAVKDAEEALATAKAKLDKLGKEDPGLAAAVTAVKNAEEALATAKTALLNKQNDLVDKINKVELFQKLNAVLFSVTENVQEQTNVLLKKNKEEEAYQEYAKKNELKAKYPDQDALDKAKKAAKDAFDKVEKDLLDKVNKNLKEADKVSNVELATFVKDGKSGNNAKDAVLKEVLSASDVKTYKDAKAANEAVMNQAAPVTDVELKNARDAYQNALDERRKEEEDSPKKEAAYQDSVKNLAIAVNAAASADFKAEVGTYKEAVGKVEEKLKEVQAGVKKAKEDLVNAEVAYEKAKKAYDADSQDLAKKSDLDLAAKTLDTAKKNLKDAEAKEMEVKGNLAKLQAKFDDFFKKYKAFNEAVIKGAGEYEIKLLRQGLQETLKDYNDFAKQQGLNGISVTDQAQTQKGKWVLENGAWYYKDENGKILNAKSWAKIDGKWYRFDEKGAMLSAKWFKDVNGRWYWLNANGRMSSNEWVNVGGNWFWAYGDGAIAENEWVYVGKKWYFAKKGGYLAMNEKLRINGVVYSFDKSGALK